VLVVPELAPKENLEAAPGSVDAEDLVSELLPNENPGAFAIVEACPSCLFSVSFFDELPKLKPPPVSVPVFFRFWAGSPVEASVTVAVSAPNLNAVVEFEFDGAGAAKLPNNPVADGAEVVDALPASGAEVEVASEVEDPKLNFGIFAFAESPDGAELLDADADTDVAEPNLKPPDVAEGSAEALGVEVVVVDDAPNLNPPDDDATVVDGAFADAALNLKPPVAGDEAAAGVAFALSPPNANPPVVDDGAADLLATALPPNENPPAEIVLLLLSPPPKLKPVLPIEPDAAGFDDAVVVIEPETAGCEVPAEAVVAVEPDAAGCEVPVASDSSSSSKGASHDAHFFASRSFGAKQALHCLVGFK